jgi:cadmium resistance protein CadD (predicted permease)
MMKMNEGPLDRILRVVAGLVLLALVFVGPKTAWGYLGLVPLITGLVGFCPLYAVVGLSTRSAKRLT